MNKLTFLFSISIIVTACLDSQDTIPFNKKRYDFDFKVGQRKLYVKDFGYTGKNGNWDYYMLGETLIEKDTLYQGHKGVIVSTQYWEPYADSLPSHYHSREMIVDEDSNVSLYEFKSNSGNPFLFSLLKSATVDTSLFTDKMIEIHYPIKANKLWATRLMGDPYYLADDTLFTKAYTGSEVVTFKNQAYECGVFTFYSFYGIQLKSWISRIGLLKAEVTGYSSLLSTGDDTSGGTADSAQWHETYALIDVDADSATFKGYLKKYENKEGP